MGPRFEFDRVGSTQSMAADHARRMGPVPALFVAARQDQGVGRSTHQWASPPGGLYLSLVARAPRGRGALVPLAIGVELARGLGDRFPVSLGVRWPNDLVVSSPRGERKIAGILVDRVATARGDALVVGVGVNVANVRHRLPVGIQSTAAFLQEFASAPVTPAEVEPIVVSAVARALTRLRTARGAAAVVRAARRLLVGVGSRITIDGVPAGVLSGLAADGSVEVNAPDGLHAISAGSLSFEGAA